MNAAVSNGLNKPELSKSLEITCAICLPISEILPFSSVKLAIAIGVGATCPSVILNCNCALVDVEKRDKKRKKDDTMTAGSVEEEEEEASRVDLYGALNVETTATSIEVRFCFFPLYSFFL